MKCPNCHSTRIMEVILWGVSCTEKKDCAQCLSCGYRALKSKFKDAAQDVSA